MNKYTVKVITKSGKTVYPKTLSVKCNEIDLHWTKDIEEAIWWEEYECADIVAVEYENAEVVIKEEKEELKQDD